MDGSRDGGFVFPAQVARSRDEMEQPRKAPGSGWLGRRRKGNECDGLASMAFLVLVIADHVDLCQHLKGLSHAEPLYLSM